MFNKERVCSSPSSSSEAPSLSCMSAMSSRSCSIGVSLSLRKGKGSLGPRLCLRTSTLQDVLSEHACAGCIRSFFFATSLDASSIRPSDISPTFRFLPLTCHRHEVLSASPCVLKARSFPRSMSATFGIAAWSSFRALTSAAEYGKKIDR